MPYNYRCSYLVWEDMRLHVNHIHNEAIIIKCYIITDVTISHMKKPMFVDTGPVLQCSRVITLSIAANYSQQMCFVSLDV